MTKYLLLFVFVQVFNTEIISLLMKVMQLVFAQGNNHYTQPQPQAILQFNVLYSVQISKGFHYPGNSHMFKDIKN